MTIKVLSREVLHHNDGHDKVYVVERLERGGASAFFTSWGKRGSTLTTTHVSASDASKRQAEKLAKGYQPKRLTVGLEPFELDMTKPIAKAIIYDAVLPAPAAPAVAATTPAALAVAPVAMGIKELRNAFASILRSGTHKGRVDASAVTAMPDDTFQVQGTDLYTVTLNPMTCTCPAFAASSPAPCKHLVAVIAKHGEEWLRAEDVRQLADAMGLADAPAVPEPAPVAVPAPEVVGTPKDPIMAIFAPHVREGESHPLVPLPERIRWNEAHARQISAGFKRRKPTLLFGPTGTGKTSLVRAFANMTNRPMLRINMTPATSTSDLVGKMVVRDGATVWQDGPLTQAMRFGYVLVVDEADRIDPGTSATLFPAMEEGGVPTLTLKEGDKVEVIEAHPDFCMFLTANAFGTQDESGLYSGTQSVDVALQGRCGMQIYVGYHDAATEAQILVDRGTPKKVAEKIVKASNAIRSMIESDAVRGAWGTRQVIHWAENTLDLGSYEEGFACTTRASFTRDEFKTLWEACQRITGTTL